MTTFAIAVTLMLALAGWMLRSVWMVHPTSSRRDTAGAASAAILAEQLAALDHELAHGEIDEARYRSARDEVRRRVLEEAPVQAQGTSGTSPGAARIARLMPALAVPVFVLALYAMLGDPAAIATQPRATEEAEASPKELQDMLASVAQRLKTPSADPASDALGWSMMARSYAGLRQFVQADDAYARAIVLDPRNAQLLADRADVLAVLQGQRTDGEPDRLIREALKIDPRNLKALALAGTAAFQSNDLAGARDYWQRARAVAPPGSEFAAGLDQSLAEIGASSDVSAAQALGAAEKQSLVAARISGRVTLGPGQAFRVKPTDTVFVFARSATGPGMPLAIIRKTVADLPFDFELDDAMAMSPQARLSSADRVIVGARVSRSGDARPASGDLQALTPPIGVHEAGVRLTLDSVVP